MSGNKIIVLDALRSSSAWIKSKRKILLDTAAARGDMEIIDVNSLKVKQCTGCFLCWVKTPGECVLKDDARLIAEKLINSDSVILLTEVTFGGYNSPAKSLLDRMIPLLHPGFEKVKGEIHHKKRYERFPDFFAAGFSEEDNQDEAELFHLLVNRNSINMRTEKSSSAVILKSGSEQDAALHIEKFFSSDFSPRPVEDIKIMKAPSEISSAVRSVKKGLLISASPKGRASLSGRVIEYISDQLKKRGVDIDVEIIKAGTKPEDRKALAKKCLSGYDFIFTAFPLYVDAAPGIVTGLFEDIVSIGKNKKKKASGETLFAAFVNCGFPEGYQNLTAINICRNFARRAGYVWAGGLPLGGGESINSSKPLSDRKRGGPPALNLLKALDMTAESLSKGGGVTPEAFKLVQRSPIPGMPFSLWKVIFNAAAGSFWTRKAAAYGLGKKDLDRKRYRDQ